MIPHIFKFIILFMLVSSVRAASAGAFPQEDSKLSDPIYTISTSVLESHLDFSSNRIIVPFKILTFLNAFASMSMDNPLKIKLLMEKLARAPETCRQYDLIARPYDFFTSYNAILLPHGLESEAISPEVSEFGLEILSILHEGKTVENAKLINTKLAAITSGVRRMTIEPTDLERANLIGLSVSDCLVSWDNSFERETALTFDGVTKRTPITYLEGQQIVGFKSDPEGTTIVINLKDGAKLVIHEHNPAKLPKFFTPSMVNDLRIESINLLIPRFSFFAELDLKECLRSSGFEALNLRFGNDLILGQYSEKVHLNSHLKGLSGPPKVVLGQWGAISYYTVDRPFTFAVVVPIASGEYLPLVMGYIGDPSNREEGGSAHSGAGVAGSPSSCVLA